ncbi:protein tyrosine phosphatase family protein [Alkalinema pantanalense CENA528]|uniref:protein tyrosine phosphatase family protein n=1 Tax=Alkalinema pantanalense TaxID=1620705 RepID=UPI003D6DBC51
MGDRVEEIANFFRISDRIGTAGQPNAFQFAAIKAAGYQTVINLALSSSDNALLNESAVAQSARLEYFHIPVVWDKPTLMDFEFFCQIMKRRHDRKLFIHCAANKRVSVFVYLWRRIQQQESHEIAQRDLEQIWQPNEIWTAFIHQVLAHYQLTPEALLEAVSEGSAPQNGAQIQDCP